MWFSRRAGLVNRAAKRSLWFWRRARSVIRAAKGRGWFSWRDDRWYVLSMEQRCVERSTVFHKSLRFRLLVPDHLGAFPFYLLWFRHPYPEAVELNVRALLVACPVPQSLRIANSTNAKMKIVHEKKKIKNKQPFITLGKNKGNRTFFILRISCFVCFFFVLVGAKEKESRKAKQSPKKKSPKPVPVCSPPISSIFFSFCFLTFFNIFLMGNAPKICWSSSLLVSPSSLMYQALD